MHALIFSVFGETPGEGRTHMGQQSLESSPALSVPGFSSPLKMWYSLGMGLGFAF